MKKLLFAFVLGLCAFAVRGHAQAACAASYPYTLTNGSTADATQVMADFNDVRTCAKSVDNSQIGVLGIYAAQVIPTTVAQATFGGTTTYTFNNGITVSGTTTLNTPLAVPSGGTGSASYPTNDLLYFDGTEIVGASLGAGLALSAGVLSCASCGGTLHVKLAIGMGFNQGAVSTATVFPTQPVVAYTGGQITGFRAACGTADNGTTVFTFTRDGSSIGTLTLANGSTVSSVTLGAPVTIVAGDYLGLTITTAGTAANCGVVAEGQQTAY